MPPSLILPTILQDALSDFMKFCAGRDCLKGYGPWIREEVLSPGQMEEIDRVYAAYPELNDDAFISENIEQVALLITIKRYSYMPEKKLFYIRPMKPDDLDQAFALSMDEGWNQTMNDWRLLLENPVNICIVAEKDNRVAGTATALNHENKVAWIGMVLVDKVLRGQGAGKMLLEEIIHKS